MNITIDLSPLKLFQLSATQSTQNTDTLANLAVEQNLYRCTSKHGRH